MMEQFGAAIERGEIMEAADGNYIVRSLTRDGITSPPIPAISICRGIKGGDGDAEIEYESYAAGDRVYFFLFGDGHGMILARF